MEVIKRHYRIHHVGIFAKELDQKLGLKRGRKRTGLLDSLEEKGLIKITRIPDGKGNPSLMIILL
jgi:hypothetical protein